MLKKKISIFQANGLGNQLFIACISIYYSNKNYKVNLIFNRNNRARDSNYLLDLLDKSGKFKWKSNKNFVYFFRVKIFIFLSKKIYKKGKILSLFRIFFEENTYRFDDKLLKLPNKSVIFGTYTNAKYVDKIWPENQDLFSDWLKSIYLPLEYSNQEMHITLHVRRGDTLDQKSKVFQNLGLLSETYYLNAINYLNQKYSTEKLKIVIVTDNLDLVKKEFNKINYSRLIGENDVTSLQALKFLSISKFFVGCNSTFSWWAGKFSKELYHNHVVMPIQWSRNNNPLIDQALVISGVDLIDSVFIP